MYGYLNTDRIRADAGSQFTSDKFAQYCIQQGIKLPLASFIPNVTTTVEHTGTLSPDDAPAEEGGESDLIDLTTPSDLPDLVDPDHDDKSTAGSDSVSEHSNLDGDDDTFDFELADLLHPTAPDPEPETPCHFDAAHAIADLTPNTPQSHPQYIGKTYALTRNYKKLAPLRYTTLPCHLSPALYHGNQL